jgi:threonine/homoserine efflux transporter RhtA
MKDRVKMERLGLFIGWCLGIVGLWFLDYFLYPTIDYFGKIVFAVAINIFWVWIVWVGERLSSGIWKQIVPIAIGAVELGIGLYLHLT